MSMMCQLPLKMLKAWEEKPEMGGSSQRDYQEVRNCEVSSFSAPRQGRASRPAGKIR